MYYQIAWCASKNALGETKYREEKRLENVILWLVSNRKSLSDLSAGCSVYSCTDDETKNSLPETIFNWQPEKEKCFGHLKIDRFPLHVFIRGGKIIAGRR